MKKIYFIFLVIMVTSNGLFSQNSGFSVRALTVAERDAMVNPAEGTRVLCTGCGKDGKTVISMYNNGQWMNLSGCIFPPVPGTNIPTQTQIIWNWSAVFGADGYLWNTVNNLNTAVNIGLVTTKTEMGLTPGTTYTRYIWAYNYCCGESDPTVLIQTTLPSAGLTAGISAQINVNCFGSNNGSATVTVAGGTPGYTYLWSDSQTTATATNLSQGTYTVTVKDSQNLTTTASATITQPAAPLTATASATPVNCGGNNGTASVTATGGSGGYTYIWNDPSGQTTSTATGLFAGTYTVTVTDIKSCTTTTSATVTQPGTLSASASATPVSCNGGNNGTASVTATGGSGGYTYKWSDVSGQTTSTATGLIAGTYTVTVTDSQGCMTTSTAPVTQPNPLTANATMTPVNCFGGNNGSAIVTATGGTSGYTYLWSNSQTNATAGSLIAGTYTVTVKDTHNCTAVATVTITQPVAALTAGISNTNHVTCYGLSNGSVTVTAEGGTQPYGFNWNTTPVQTTQTANGLSAGTYTVTVTDNKGCTATGSQTITIPIEMLQLELRSVAPLCAGGNNGTAGITVTGGTTPYSYKWSTNPQQSTQNAVGLMAGNYTVTVSDAHTCTLTSMVTVTEPSPLVVQASSTPVFCFGGNNGSSTLTVTGGTPGYTYLWNTTPAQSSSTAGSLTAGTYTVTVKDTHNCTATATVTITQPSSSFTINHVAGDVAPVTKTVTYGTVTNIPGEPTKCWITSNLGADHQATAVDDATEPSAGWYWQFNRKQGYKHDGTTVTPSWNIFDISENSDWQATNDPCTIELGSGWRIPTLSEWTNVDASGGWTDWNGPWNSGLKMHAAGMVLIFGGSLSGRGVSGVYWSSTQTNIGDSWYLAFASGTSTLNSFFKALGMPLRCLKETITQPPAPLTAGITGQTNVTCFGGNNGSATVTVTGGTPGYAYLWSNGQTMAAATSLSQGTFTVTVTDSHNNTATSTATITQPGSSFTINHVAGDVAPVNKTVTYGTVTNIPGEPTKCWITSNLGADHQATAVDDATEPSAGWYWQFNRKQGYKHDGTTVTPSWEITDISENSDWQATNDPCTIELGSGWRIPTLSEWTNVDASGGWTDWNGPWNSGLKMHAAGMVLIFGGSLSDRGVSGVYWSSTQTNIGDSWYLAFASGSSTLNSFFKALGMPLRCLKD